MLLLMQLIIVPLLLFIAAFRFAIAMIQLKVATIQPGKCIIAAICCNDALKNRNDPGFFPIMGQFDP